MSEQDLRADPENVSKATNYLLEKFHEYASENPMSLIDVFMTASNFHKRIVTDVALRWSANGMGMMKTYKMADMTFRKAMKDLWRS